LRSCLKKKKKKSTYIWPEDGKLSGALNFEPDRSSAEYEVTQRHLS
jgi:hypothetical protein